MYKLLVFFGFLFLAVFSSPLLDALKKIRQEPERKKDITMVVLREKEELGLRAKLGNRFFLKS
tara:strand:+ start:423 stop:611 length:189 start_codon:yes stop_codon:yes gene_type:complete